MPAAISLRARGLAAGVGSVDAAGPRGGGGWAAAPWVLLRQPRPIQRRSCRRNRAPRHRRGHGGQPASCEGEQPAGGEESGGMHTAHAAHADLWAPLPGWGRAWLARAEAMQWGVAGTARAAAAAPHAPAQLRSCAVAHTQCVSSSPAECLIVFQSRRRGTGAAGGLLAAWCAATFQQHARGAFCRRRAPTGPSAATRTRGTTSLTILLHEPEPTVAALRPPSPTHRGAAAGCDVRATPRRSTTHACDCCGAARRRERRGGWQRNLQASSRLKVVLAWRRPFGRETVHQIWF